MSRQAGLRLRLKFGLQNSAWRATCLHAPASCPHPVRAGNLDGRSPWPAGTPNAQINLEMEVYGSTIQPFNSTKASIIGQGIANLLADGTEASQISVQDQGDLAAVSSPASLHCCVLASQWTQVSSGQPCM